MKGHYMVSNAFIAEVDNELGSNWSNREKDLFAAPSWAPPFHIYRLTLIDRPPKTKG
jgi:hypothetical protein